LLLNFITALGWIAGGLAAIGTAYGLTATALSARFILRPARRPSAYPAVSVIKPLHGDHAGLAEALKGFCEQDYPGEVQIIFGVQDYEDAAADVVRALQARRPDMDIELVIDPSLHGTNRKVSNLINIAARARHEVLVLSDADIAVRPGYLRQVVGALETPGVGAVSCLYVGKADASLWSGLGAMAVNYHFLPNAVFSKTLRLAQPCFGSTIAITGAVLERIGGLAAFANQLADDYEIGAAVRRLGYEIAVPPMVVSHQAIEPSAYELVEHELRWGRTVRQIRPAGYAGSFITYPLPLALIAAPLAGFSHLAVTLILAALGMRIACKLVMDLVTGVSAGQWWMIPVRDCLSFGIFVTSFTVNTVGWQGRRFRVGRDGVLSHS
jgi:ceramide glucosyltransferase